MQLNVKDMNGKEVGQIKLDDAVFNKEYKEALIHQVVVAQLANRRQGTHSALKAAFLSAISEKMRQSEVTVLDKLALKEAKTKLFQNVIDALKLEGKVIFVTEGYDETLIRAIRNIPDAQVQEARTLSVYDIVANRNRVFTKSAIEQFEEANK